MEHQHSAGVLVFDKNKVLLLQYLQGHWDFPKGHVEAGETPEEAALRELLEETGLTAEIIPGFRETISYSFGSHNRIKKDVVFFLGTTNSAEVRLSHEHQGFAWLPFEDALKKVTFENARSLLKKAHIFLNKK